MAVVNKMELGRELFTTISQINNLIDWVKAEAEEADIPPIRMRDSRGDLVLIPLLVGKAQCLNALAIINQRD